MDGSITHGFRVGSINLQLLGSVSVFTEYSDRLIAGAQSREVSGTVGNPADMKARGGLSWDVHGWAGALFVNHVDGLRNKGADPRIVRTRVDSQTTVDLQLGYTIAEAAGSLLDDLELRLGVSNLFDEKAPFVDGPTQFGVDTKSFRAEGRTAYLQVKKSFGLAAR